MPAVVSVSLIVGLWSRWILWPGRSPAGGCAVCEHSSPWHLLGHHPPQIFTKVAVFSVQKLILNRLGDIRDIPGCNQFDAQSHVLQKAKGATTGSEEFSGPVKVTRASGTDPACFPLLPSPQLPQPPPASLGAHLKEYEEGKPGCEDVPELDRVAVVIGVPVIPVPAAQPHRCQPRLPLCWASCPAAAPSVGVREKPWQLPRHGCLQALLYHLPVPQLQAGCHSEGLGEGVGGILLSNGCWLLLPALLDLVAEKAWQRFGQLCVWLEVLNAEDGEAVVDVAG